MDPSEEDIPETKRPPLSVRLSPDGMQAYLLIPRTKGGEEISVSVREITEALQSKGVTYGIRQDEILDIVDDPIPGREVLVAEGKPPIDGKPGLYHYSFHSDLSKKPKVLPDGSVDYMAMKTIEAVAKGDVIATYEPAVPSSDGTTVTGKRKAGKPGRDLPPLIGKGFTRSLDGLTYTADITGKIEVANKRIIISPVYEVKGVVGVDVGNIDFAGDVIIHGPVTNGVQIRSGGSVTIEGLVENCTIRAKGDIFLKKGVKGSGRTVIRAHGSIEAQFIEYADVWAGGDIEADVLFKSHVLSDAMIRMTGKSSSVVGGSIDAVEGLECFSAGNRSEVDTELYAGVSAERQKERDQLEKKIRTMDGSLIKIRDGLKRFDALSAERGVDLRSDPRRIKLLRAKIQIEAEAGAEKVKLADLDRILARGRHARIRIERDLYPGVTVGIGGAKKVMTEKVSHLECRLSPKGLRFEHIIED